MSSQITAIRATKRDPSRATVKVDGKVVATLSIKQVAELGLRVDQVWDDELATRIENAAALDKAMRDATRRLNRHAYSRSQLADKLKGLDHREEVIERVLDRLCELRMVDDEALGRSLIESIRRRKPAGARLLRQKLRHRKLDGELIERLIAEADEADEGGEGQVVAAAELARQKLRTLQRYDAKTRKRRLWGLLSRRGFDYETIDAAMRQLGSLEDDPPEAF